MFCSFNSNDLYVWLRLTLNVQAPSSKSVAASLLNHGVQSWSKSVGSVGVYHFNIIVRRIQLTNLVWGEYLHSGKMMQSKPYSMEDYNCMFQSALIAKRTLTSMYQSYGSENRDSSNDQKRPTNQKQPGQSSKTGKNLEKKRRLKDEKNAIIKIDLNMFGGTRQEKSDKKLRSMLFLTLGNDGKRVFSQSSSK